MAMSEEVAHLVREFEWTRPRHGGDVEYAAPIFGMTPEGLDWALRRANDSGARVKYKGVHRE